jgi:peptidoglycan hydrolase-like protein with peptidoglycan-binding domain
MTRRFVLLSVAVGFALVEAVSADDNVREVQMKLRDGGFYSGEIELRSGSLCFKARP